MYQINNSEILKNKIEGVRIMTNNSMSHKSDYDEDLFETVLKTLSLWYSQEHSRRIKEGIRRSKEKKALLEQSDTKNPDQQSSKKKKHD